MLFSVAVTEKIDFEAKTKMIFAHEFINKDICIYNKIQLRDTGVIDQTDASSSFLTA